LLFPFSLTISRLHVVVFVSPLAFPPLLLCCCFLLPLIEAQSERGKWGVALGGSGRGGGILGAIDMNNHCAAGI